MEMNGFGGLPIKLYLQEQAEGGTWPQDRNCRVLSYNIDFLKIMHLGKKDRGKFRVSHCKISAIVLTILRKQPVYNLWPIQGDQEAGGNRI